MTPSTHCVLYLLIELPHLLSSVLMHLGVQLVIDLSGYSIVSHKSCIGFI